MLPAIAYTKPSLSLLLAEPSPHSVRSFSTAPRSTRVPKKPRTRRPQFPCKPGDPWDSPSAPTSLQPNTCPVTTWSKCGQTSRALPLLWQSRHSPINPPTPPTHTDACIYVTLWLYSSAEFLLPQGRWHYHVMNTWECDHMKRNRGRRTKPNRAIATVSLFVWTPDSLQELFPDCHSRSHCFTDLPRDTEAISPDFSLMEQNMGKLAVNLLS